MKLPTPKSPSLAAFGILAMTLGAHGAGVTLAYWDFDTGGGLVESVAGITTTAVGTPDISVHPTYGSSGGSGGQSLNIALGDSQNYVVADTFPTISTDALYFGTESFSVSYWLYNADDGDTRAMRAFDMMEDTGVGLQILGGTTPNPGTRIEGDVGTTNHQILGEGTYTTGEWQHVAITFDRGGDYTVYINGAMSGTPTPLTITGNVYPTRDITIGVNTGGASDNPGHAQAGAIDDLAFYSGVLDGSQIAALSAGTATPITYVPEPSIALLGALGILGLVRRRR